MYITFQLTHSYSQLIQYKNKFELRFSASNLLHLNQLIYVIGKLINMLGNVVICILLHCLILFNHFHMLKAVLLVLATQNLVEKELTQKFTHLKILYIKPKLIT